jgi:hypothetical protein
MSTLKSTIEELANEFALSIIGALREASIDEISSVTGRAARRGRGARGSAEENGLGLLAKRPGRGGKRLGRRSIAEIGHMIDSIVDLLDRNPAGLRAEQIREELQCQAKELPRPLADGLSAGRLKKTGQKRATTYFVGDGTPPSRRGRSVKTKRNKRG